MCLGLHASCGGVPPCTVSGHYLSDLFKSASRGGGVFPIFPPHIQHCPLWDILSDFFSNLPPGDFFSLPHRWQCHLWLFQICRLEGNFTHQGYHQKEFFPSTQLATLTFSNLAPEGWGSRDMGSGGSNFILEKSFTTPGPHDKWKSRCRPWASEEDAEVIMVLHMQIPSKSIVTHKSL